MKYGVNKNLISIGITSLLLAFSVIANAAPRCAAVPADNMAYARIHLADLAEQAAANYPSPNVETFKKLEALKTRNRAFAQNTNFHEALYRVLQDESLSTFHELLDRVVEKVDEAFASSNQNSRLTARSTQEQVMTAFRSALNEELVKFMPERMAAARVALLESTVLNKEIMLQALGRLSAKESLEAMIGPNGIHEITPDSLVGRYIAKARAAGHDVSTGIAQFYRAPTGGASGA